MNFCLLIRQKNLCVIIFTENVFCVQVAVNKYWNVLRNIRFWLSFVSHCAQLQTLRSHVTEWTCWLNISFGVTASAIADSQPEQFEWSVSYSKLTWNVIWRLLCYLTGRLLWPCNNLESCVFYIFNQSVVILLRLLETNYCLW